MPKKARATFAKADKKTGFPIVISEDDIYADDHPFVKAWPDEFVDLMDSVTVHGVEAPKREAPVVEQATAAPGEVREVSKPAEPVKRGPGRPRKET
jgi:hypothetical protein